MDYWTIFWDAAMYRSMRRDTGWGWYWSTATVVEKCYEAEWIFCKTETDDAFDKNDIIYYYVNNITVTMVITEDIRRVLIFLKSHTSKFTLPCPHRPVHFNTL